MSFRWPSFCQICHAWPSTAVCTSCVARFAQPMRRCPRCAQALASDVCESCQTLPSVLDACLTAVSYGFPWDSCVARLKFQSDLGWARHLAHLMHHAPHVEPALEAAQLVLPMPLSASRLRERGFNQADALAKQLAPNKAHANLLLRSGDGAHQVGASREERLALVEHVFWIAPKALPTLRNQRVVLVDDVMTTGATLYAAARVLRAAGVAHITGLVFARAERHHMAVA